MSLEQKLAHVDLKDTSQLLATLSNPPTEVELATLLEAEEFKFLSKLEQPDQLPYKLYALYRSNLPLPETSNDLVSSKLIYAQNAYRDGHLKQALNLLKSLKSELKDEADLSDLEVNLSAIYALMGLSSPTLDADFEQLFNYSCSLLVKGDLKNALSELQKTLKLAEDDEDNQKVRSQIVYAHILLNDFETAGTLNKELMSLLRGGLLSPDLEEIVKNNQIVIDQQNNPVDLESAHVHLRVFDTISRLPTRERQVLQRNAIKLMAKVHHPKAIKHALKHAEEYPTDIEPLVIALNFNKVKKLKVNTAKNALFSAQNNTNFNYPTKSKYFGFDLDILRGCNDDELRDVAHGKIDLSAIDELVADVDVDKIEFSKPKQVAQKRRRAANSNLDPERWLPKRDRSGFKEKLKKSQSTQGGAAGSEETNVKPQREVVGKKKRSRR